ncbi:hypothetical protein [Armatimonas rosea]|uniref:Uncharacterized protein n=1 Tax=Armatimonas rosea TaxID=685828 RepID=A0A7W9SWW8_ARMRO|nr:hypothetical protein [Armatimonas rosea]MBB6053488.1 hypothetical protein [Armatimonas rosea]
MSRARKWARGALGLLVVAALGTTAWVLALMAERDSRLPKLALTLPDERERASHAGLPRKMAELPKRPPLLPAENAALLYREAVNVLPEWTPEDRATIQRALGRSTALSASDTKRLSKLVRAAQPALALTLQGVLRPHCNFGWDTDLTDDEWKQRREVLMGCDRLARLLLVQGRALKNPTEKLSNLARVEHLTRHLTEEPGLLVWQLRGYHAGLVANALYELASREPTLQPVCEEALRAWEPPVGILKRAWWVQCIKEQADARQSRTKPYKTDDAPFLDYNPLWRELDRLDHLLGWKLYADASEVINLRYWREVKNALATVNDKDLTAQWRVLAALDTAEERRAKAFNGYWYPQRYSGVAAQLVVMRLNQELLPLALALGHYRQQQGTYPDTLKALPGAPLVTDPFSGKPLHWKAPVLYSVGPDGKDNGGDPQKDIVLDLDAGRRAPLARSPRGAFRRPGRTTGAVQ